jgi:5-methylcytosine-specific restriction endonuclease McrA
VAVTKSQVYGSAWRRVRRAVLLRDAWLCQIRAEGCLGWADEVDHILSWRLWVAACLTSRICGRLAGIAMRFVVASWVGRSRR